MQILKRGGEKIGKYSFEVQSPYILYEVQSCKVLENRGTSYLAAQRNVGCREVLIMPIFSIKELYWILISFFERHLTHR